ncbi:MAG TPA: hypothetical protein VMI54_15330 [Polyangiaceae bacterium]|nr:hypothetical protein [Polyangiaceae bacterium]
MNHDDPVLARLAALPNPPTDPARTARLREAALLRLRPRRLHPAWAVLVASSTVAYLGSALYFAVRLF